MTTWLNGLLARKSILAGILKYVVPEFANSSFDDIEKNLSKVNLFIVSILSLLDDTPYIKSKSTKWAVLWNLYLISAFSKA